jgi:hypothetical protein
MAYYVNYTIAGAPAKAFQAGLYRDFDEAASHSRDIKSYVGVSDVYISDFRNENRQLVGGNAESV